MAERICRLPTRWRAQQAGEELTTVRQPVKGPPQVTTVASALRRGHLVVILATMVPRLEVPDCGAILRWQTSECGAVLVTTMVRMQKPTARLRQTLWFGISDGQLRTALPQSASI